MPSLFSRSRTTSTPNKKPSFLSSHDEPTLDEFGRVSSRNSNRAATFTPSKKDKKKAEKRNKTLNTRDLPDEQALTESVFPDGTFLPLSLERPKSDPDAGERPREQDYGYLSYERHVVLGLEQAARLVNVVSDELESRGGLTTPFIFSTTALDISSSAIKRLIRAFLGVCAAPPGRAWEEAERKWREEARFAGPHELGMCLRWGLARIIRSSGGQDVRGLVSWDHYCEFRDSEAALGYPSNHFEHFIRDLVPDLQSIILRVLTLLTRLTANSTSSGHTPPSLSPLFGPLLFGLGPATLTFHHAYVHYLRAVNAMEHTLLAFIRWQDTPAMASNGLYSSGSAAALGVPTRLKEWIKGYPAMLPMLNQPKNARPEPRKGARTIRVMSVRRNVRMYSPDLVKTASTWAARRPGGAGANSLAVSKQWDRIAPWSLKLAPRYSEAYKKRMNMPPNFHPEVSPGTYATDTLSHSSSTSSYVSTLSTATGTTTTSLTDSDYFGLGGREGEDRFRSLTDLKWGEFESMGFGGLGDEKKLQFDLTETARTERSAKRATLSWNDFSNAGFTRTDGSLSATLQFSTPIAQSVSSWPTQNAEISKKLKKTQKSLPAFGWDTEPVIGSEEVIEEAFVDVFCDLVYGGGWMDLERGEELDRDCNWALVEYKSLPPDRSTATGGSDPRTSTTLALFEEFVPLEYRQQLAVKTTTRRRLPSLFSPGKSKQWKQAPTLNGRPYVVGHVPRSPSYREVEFDSLLRGGGNTKVISLGSKNPVATPARAQHVPEPPATVPRTMSKPVYVPEEKETPAIPTARSDELHSDSTTPSVTSPSMKRMSRFKLPGGIPVPSPGGLRKAGITPAEYSTVEFETRMASYSDDELNGGLAEPESVKQKRRESRDDAWVDILVNSHSRRLAGQDAEMGPTERRRGMRGRRSDPDLASLEVAQVLASVQNRSPSPPSIHNSGRVDRDYGMDQHLDDLDVVEIETVPRTSDVHRHVDTDEEDEAVLAYRDERDYEQESEYAADDDIVTHEPEPEPEPEPTKHVAKQQRRLGYFDLHPERRPIAKESVGDEDPRTRLARGDDSDGEGDNAPVPAASSAIRPLPVPPRDSPPPPRQPSPLPNSSPEDEIVPYHPPQETKKPEVERLLPVPPQRPAVNIPEKPIAAPVPSSKTAALIEMYRERERGGSSPVVPPASSSSPSRLPVRTASLPKDTLPFPAIPQTLPASPKPSSKAAVPPPPKPSPRPSPPELEDIDLPPPAPFIDPGRASPARYVHGAPLHNVLEEEEEED